MSLAELLEQIIGHGVNIELSMTITLADIQPDRETFEVECECGWTRSYKSESSSKKGLRTHKQHCPTHNGHMRPAHDKSRVADDEQDVAKEFPWLVEQ